MESYKSYKRRFFKGLKNLSLTWKYSDSQPTEIVLAICLMILAPIALGIEIGGLYIFRFLLIPAGIYQLICVANGEIKCRLKASMIVFGLYSASAIMVYSHIGFPTPTHYGWVVFVVASFGSMSRLIREKIYRDNG